jgi:hypothetical protein
MEVRIPVVVFPLFLASCLFNSGENKYRITPELREKCPKDTVALAIRRTGSIRNTGIECGAPANQGYVLRLKVFNGAGDLVLNGSQDLKTESPYETMDPWITWVGQNNQGEEVPSGYYFLFCEITPAFPEGNGSGCVYYSHNGIPMDSIGWRTE